jgi:hypothetical protein
MVEAAGECATEVGERMVLEGEGVLRGTGELKELAGLSMELEVETERMEVCGTGGTGDGWDVEGEEVGEGVEERDECFMAERRG